MKLIEKIERIFRDLKFEKELINDTFVFVCNGKYRKVTFIKKLESFVIEYADSYDEAEKNLYEDGDLYPISLGENELINRMRNELVDSL
ncbi:hypothetical protein PC41400_08995 [Paenibacillus chitinolyticus]|uniref:Uncharacterized protein n=1 Tax=Paenibacillus chitinolyticus TaxID=79263 RepID=A0A410WTY8_9BACL|nr:hypothetical protein [Paenibacillus chitinolyticus]MCY9591351.1 hypothetical protein [Paenibacillus chitinolyticus]MCY9597412.1 hypothetical protein [Paenibacillus chitinolyticus]QAV17790.1 hypothetical protein PC41400_08995 [Paenibacillus chitinolyticus]